MHKSFSSPLDAAMINVERLSALAGLLAVEGVASEFANLSPLAQVALFGTFESGLSEVRTALLQVVGCGGGARARRYKLDLWMRALTRCLVWPHAFRPS
ncbi:hypothetical protein [Burkholderia pseudomallei]|uniref:hypothetical protein n=1 Tax=Burkholderia pseudomallei TaxID=28450 RepID=UPI001FB935E7|nr:hypothetical protein [Burkholderia pseudomallei]